MTTKTKDKLERQLFGILMDYGDFFLTNYPQQSETKSIWPTIRKIEKLFEHQYFKKPMTTKTKDSKEWYKDFEKMLWVNKNKVVTYEQYIRLRGKYNNPTDKLLDAIWIISNKQL